MFSTFTNSHLRISSWNIHGHIHRLAANRDNKFNNPDFLELLCNSHIVGLSETHAGPYDDIDIPGYVIFKNCREISRNDRFFGGVAVYVRESLAHMVTPLKITRPDIIWLKLDKGKWGLDFDLYLATVYIPPESSSFSSDLDPFASLLNDITKFTMLGGKCMIMGDFNAYTNTAPDFALCDDDMHIPLPTSYVPDCHLVRRNRDRRPLNRNGKEFLGVCISSGCRIVNGRKLGDSSGQ